jgi:hypothetical protein
MVAPVTPRAHLKERRVALLLLLLLYRLLLLLLLAGGLSQSHQAASS